jgi:exodeoxyribonuclease VII large subunit
MKQQDLFGGSPPPKPSEPASKPLPAAAPPAEPEWVRAGTDAEAPAPPPRPIALPPALVRAPPVVAVPSAPVPVADPLPAWRREPPKKSEPKILTVGQLTRAIKDTLEPVFGRVLVKGEVSGFRGPNVRGHLYFALKDDVSSIDLKVWQTTAARMKFALKDGLSVIVEGSIDLYEPSGRYSLIVQRIEPTGVGAQALAYAQLKAKLMAEGLFGPNRTQPRRALPTLPRRVGVVTSISGAALRDFLKVLHRRHPRLAVLVADTRVQGDGAEVEIARAIRRLGRQQVDVIVVTRGGGSAEDLWCFNEEIVARAIFECPVPVVSAVGHEVDTTLADHVADFRAPTPSAAAEAIAPVLADLQLYLATTRARMRKAVERRILEGHHQLGSLQADLGDPRRGLSQRRLHLSEQAEKMRAGLERTTRERRDALRALNVKLHQLRPQAQLLATRKALHQLAARLQSAASYTFRREREAFSLWRDRLHHVSPRPAAHAARGALQTVKARLPMLMKGAIVRERAALQALEGQLDALSPLKVLSRGYAIAFRSADGRAVRSADDVKSGDGLRIKLLHGEVDATVTGSRQTSYTPSRDDDKNGES